MRATAIAIAITALGCGGKHDAPDQAVVPTVVAGIAPLGMSVDDALLLNLSTLAVGRPPPPDYLAAARGQPIEGYIDGLLSTDLFSEYAGRSVLLGPLLTTEDHAQGNLIKLHSFEATIAGQKQTIYQLLDPCDPKDVVSVRPWWSTDVEIKICSSAYAPTHLVDPQTGFRCGSMDQVDQLRNLAAQRTADHKPLNGVGTYCGCGPALVFCVADETTRVQARASLEGEASETVAHVVREDRPLEEAFTHNETFRDSMADFFYQRPRWLAGEIKTLPPIDNKPARWQPRVESWSGEHAGIFTSYHVLHLVDGDRPRMRDYFSIAWCNDEGSHGATAEKVFGLGVTNLRSGDGWQKLAAMPMCTNCHARLDYGMQFFTGFPSGYIGFFDSHALVGHGSGPIYGDDISDPRGTAELTPAGFARLVVSQPEFGRCVARRVARHVFGDSVSPDDIDALEKVFAQTHRVKPLMREALLRFAASWNQPQLMIGGGPAAAVDPPHAKDPSGQIAVDPSLRRMIDAHCADCHDKDKAKSPEGDFTVARLDRAKVQDMLHRVAWGDMPRSHGIKKSEREDIVHLLIGELWPAGPERATAERYYVGLQALPLHSAAAIRNATAGAPADLSLEEFVDPTAAQYTPGFVSAIAKSALKLCTDQQGAELDTCIHDHVAPVTFVDRRLPWLTNDAQR